MICALLFHEPRIGGECLVGTRRLVSVISLRLLRMRTAVVLVRRFWWLVCWCFCDRAISMTGE